MKKLIIVILSLVAFVAVASAQPRAIGVRAGFGGELSYQHYVGGENFVEADLGISSHGFYLTGIYDFKIGQSGQFNFYAGPGAGAGAYAYTKDGGATSMAINLAVGGQIGAEWQIPAAPINISLDWRPMFHLFHGGFGWDSFCLGLRYRF